jgi:hypothetical protein
VGIQVSEIENFFRRIEQSGGRVIIHKTALPNIGWFGVCQDTEGNTFVISEREKTSAWSSLNFSVIRDCPTIHSQGRPPLLSFEQAFQNNLHLVHGQLEVDQDLNSEMINVGRPPRHIQVHCFSNTNTLTNFLPSALTPLVVTVIVPLDMTVRPVAW